MLRAVSRAKIHPDRSEPHERIAEIGGPGWRLSHAKAVAHVEAHPASYYVDTGVGLAWLTVMRHDGHRYLTTDGDGPSQSCLLALPEC